MSTNPERPEAEVERIGYLCKVIVDYVTDAYGDSDWWAMDEKGYIRTFERPEQVVSWVARRDKESARRGRSTMTTIEWRHTPEGFVPPSPTQIDRSGSASDV